MLKKLYPLIKPAVMRLDAETAHNVTIKTLSCPLSVQRKVGLHQKSLKQDILGLSFGNPVGLAAGFDKNAQVMDAMLGFGFGFVEAGTVTPKSQEGNPKPRVFRETQSNSVINKMGFPNEGADIFEQNISKFRRTGKNKSGIVGINIGKNKDTESFSDDYTTLIKRFAPQADYLTVNISSPNTEGLRDIQDPKHLAPFLDDLLKAREESAAPSCPIFVKLAPDLDETTLIAMTDILCDKKIDGVILTNTTNSRPESLPEGFRARQGGLSGPLLKSKSIATISTVYKRSKGKLLIIGAGGISSAEDAFDMISAGASLLQLYTALIYQGPSVAEKISQDLAILLHHHKIDHISALIGRDHK